MKQKRCETLGYPSGPGQSETSKVEDLAKHMSELRRLRERVRTAEAAARGLAKDEAVFVKHSS
jgi:hypothetical protein